MIDFRYHLVSLVAVFMALAVGIVLGAGPLGQEISSTLEGQVRDLREERNGLRDQLGQAEAREDLKDQVLEIVTPSVTADQLTGHRVAMVTLPGADRNLVDTLQDDISVAGGAVALTVRLDDSWEGADSLATQHEVAAELSPDLAEPSPRGDGEPTVETVLAAAVTGQDAVPGSGAWRVAIDRLGELGFIDVTWGARVGPMTDGPPDSVVIVTGSLDTAQVEASEGGEARLQQSLDLVAAFGDIGVPTLVAGYGTDEYSAPVQASQSPVVRGVRAEAKIAEAVSSVDNAEGASGRLAAILALHWAIDGQPGHWGLGTDAVAPSPTVPEPILDPVVPGAVPQPGSLMGQEGSNQDSEPPDFLPADPLPTNPLPTDPPPTEPLPTDSSATSDAPTP